MADDSELWRSTMDAEWQSFLERRTTGGGVWQRRRLNGVTNDTWLLTPADRDDLDEAYVVRHYRRTLSEDDIRFELAAVRHLASVGFPVADVVAARDGASYDHIDGRPCVAFEYVSGTAGESPGETGEADLGSGLQAARLLARMHRVTRGREFPGSRLERPDPLIRLGGWLSGDGADPELLTISGGADFLHGLQRLMQRCSAELDKRPDVWVGLVHADVAPNNLIFDDAGSIRALIDFDDCLHSYVAYDLCSILWYWGRTESGAFDAARMSALANAYCEERRLTGEERRLLPSLLAAFLAANAVGQISWWWRGARQPRPMSQIASAQAFLDVTSDPTIGERILD